MLCFNYTVGFLLIAPVLSRALLGASPGGPSPNQARLQGPAREGHPKVPARPARSEVIEASPSEPIFLPKLQIYFAEFPYLHCFYNPEATRLGDLMRLSVRSTKGVLARAGFSWASKVAASGADITAPLLGPQSRFSRQASPRVQGPLREGVNSSDGPYRRPQHKLKRYRTLPPKIGAGILTRFPFAYSTRLLKAALYSIIVNFKLRTG